jgi:hypothetical protein
MNEPREKSPWGFWTAIASLVLMAGGAVVLFLFDPSGNSYYPSCPLHELTGWSCPGCGSLRAMHQLTHGNIAAAFRFNPLLVILLPVVGWLIFREYMRLLTGKKLPGLVTYPACGWALAVVVVLFGILRNLPLPQLMAWSH